MGNRFGLTGRQPPYLSNPKELKRQNANRQSVLDAVMDDLKSLNHKASKRDKEKLDEYYSSVRAVEKGIERSMNPPAKDWVSPMKPVFNRPPAGIPRNRDLHLKLMIDLMLSFSY